MLKKQTVWLLTMVSLMIVLSVYYMMSKNSESAYIYNDENDMDQTVHQLDKESDVHIDDIQPLQDSELFTTMRMLVQDERNMKLDRLKSVVASGDASISEINEAKDEIDYLEKIETKENILQNTILSTDENYEDVLVRAEKEKVHVHVITDHLSSEAAVHIMQMVIDELGDIKVDVNFQPVHS